MPLGMSAFKKISDFLIDEKIPIHQKEKVSVIESGGEIAWVVGLRIDNRFKQLSSTEPSFVAAVSDLSPDSAKKA